MRGENAYCAICLALPERVSYSWLFTARKSQARLSPAHAGMATATPSISRMRHARAFAPSSSKVGCIPSEAATKFQQGVGVCFTKSRL